MIAKISTPLLFYTNTWKTEAPKYKIQTGTQIDTMPHDLTNKCYIAARAEVARVECQNKNKKNTEFEQEEEKEECLEGSLQMKNNF